MGRLAGLTPAPRAILRIGVMRMPDREKVIKDSEEAIDILTKAEEPTFWMDFVRCAFENALVLLKEQEAVAVHDPGAYCPKCGWMLYPEDHPHHCGSCGQAVKWDA